MINNNDFLIQLYGRSNKKIINLLKKSTNKLFPKKNNTFRRNVKFTVTDYIKGILYVLYSGLSWNKSIYITVNNKTLFGNTLRKKNYDFVKYGIYDDTFKKILKHYLKFNKKNELNTLSIDSTFIQDKVKFDCDYSKHNGCYSHGKHQTSKGIKITSIVTSKGIPISTTLTPGNKHDSGVLVDSVNNIVVKNQEKRYFYKRSEC